MKVSNEEIIEALIEATKAKALKWHEDAWSLTTWVGDSLIEVGISRPTVYARTPGEGSVYLGWSRGLMLVAEASYRESPSLREQILKDIKKIPAYQFALGGSSPIIPSSTSTTWEPISCQCC